VSDAFQWWPQNSIPGESMRSLLLICLVSMTTLALADEPVVDPPDRVARLSYMQGDVSVAPAGTEEWAEGILNRPLTSGDRIWVDSSARAELQVGSATIHLDQNSGLQLVDLDDNLMHLQITEGSANIRVLRKRDDERIEVETPNATVTLLHPGEYLIEANSAGDQTTVRTRGGASEVVAANGSQRSWQVESNQQGVFDGSGELTATLDTLGPRTAFEDWANDRNRSSESPQSSRYVSNEVVGYEDLDRYGSWVSYPEYGYVWRPTTVVAGWAPYRYGRWVWVSPWGWNWVDSAPWGFAPFHYGRWAYLQSRWCWVPGPRHVRPVYAPALVAWTGGSPGVGVSISAGVGWFPLGPREVYVPGYRYSRGYLNRVNVSNTIIVNNTYITNIYNGRHPRFDYRYGRNPRAVTVVDRERFIGGRPLDGHWSRVDAHDLRRWHSNPRPPAMAPNRDSVMAARILGRIPDRQRDHRPEVTRPGASGQSSHPARVSFDAERRAIEANGGRPVGRDQLVRNPRPTAGGVNNLRRNPDVARNDNDARRARGEAARAQLGTNRPAQVESRGDDANRPPVRARTPNNDRLQDRPAATGEAANVRPSRQFSDRPSWAQRQNAAQSPSSTDRRRSFERADAARDAGDRSSRSRAEVNRTAPAAESFQQRPPRQVRPQVQDNNATRQWRNDNRPSPRTEASAPPRPLVDRERSVARPNQASRQYQPPPAPRVERRVTPPPAAQPRQQAAPPVRTPNTGSATRNNNSSRRDGNGNSGRGFRTAR
jgi:hypothetical protein